MTDKTHSIHEQALIEARRRGYALPDADTLSNDPKNWTEQTLLACLFDALGDAAQGTDADAVVALIDARFQSGNAVPVSQARIRREEWDVLRRRLS